MNHLSYEVKNKLSKLQVRLNNALINANFAFSLCEHDCQVYSSKSELENPTVLTSFIQAGKAEIKVEFGSYDLLALHPLVQANGNYEQLPYILQIALLEYNLANLLSILSNIFDVNMSFLDKSSEISNYLGTCQLSLKIDLDGEVIVPIKISIDDEKLISSLILKLENSFSYPMLDLDLPLSFEAGTISLSLHEIKELALGDVLLPRDYLPRQQKLLVKLAHNDHNIDYAFLCKIENQQAIVLEQYKAYGEKMSEEKEVQLSELELELSFELDRKLVSLKEIQEIGKDYIFELKSEPLAPVNIRIMDKLFAQGKIVDIDGAIGVQLTNILMK